MDVSGGFGPETFARRRAAAFQALGRGALVLPASPVLFRSRDTEHRYRPDSELYYLTGFTEPEAVAVLSGGAEDPQCVLFIPERDPKAERWSGPRMGPDEARERLGVDAVHPLEGLEKRLGTLLAGAGQIFFRLGVHPRVERLVVQALQTSRNRGARTGIGPFGVTDPGRILDELRLRKEPAEVLRIKEAAQATVEGFRQAMGGTRPGMGEWEVESLLEASFRSGGARGPAFPTIVGAGKNGCVLHYADNAAVIQEGDLVLLDGGAEKALYAGDVSRTFPAAGAFTETQRALYQVVLRAHGAAIEAVRPGNAVARVHEAALDELTRGLVELEVLSGDVEELVRRKAYEPYFPHQTSHWLGLDVHDAGDYAVEGASRVLEPGMVLTVEPGLYFASGPDRTPGPFSGLGIRIEDDLLVTEDGAENLTEALPVSPDEVEALVGSG